MEHEPAGYRAPLSADGLIHERRLLEDVAVFQLHPELSVRGQAEATNALQRQPHDGGIRARVDDDVVFQAPALAVESEVHAAVDVAIEQRAIRGDVRPPAGG